jgi:hypothetical protein
MHSGHHRNVIEGNLLLKIADLELNNNDSFYTQMRYNCCNSATMTSLSCYLFAGPMKRKITIACFVFIS